MVSNICFENCIGVFTDVAQARPTLHATLMQRMTDVLSRMLNDPVTRARLGGGGEGRNNEQETPTHVNQLSALSLHSDTTEESSSSSNNLEACSMASLSIFFN